ncbi:MAG: HAD family hydrolase [Angustibacter sp.]
MTAPRAVVFDLGNVLIRWDPHPAIARGVGPEHATRLLGATDFDFLAWNHEQDAGRRWLDGEALVAQSHPHWAEAVRAYREHFAEALVGPVHDTVELLTELHAAGVRLLALTNWSAELFPVARRDFPFLGLFDDIVVSGEEQVAKPDARIFRVLERRAGIPLAQCVFIDDSPRNVEAARALGMDAILFEDTGHLRADLHERGLPVSAPDPG